MSSKVKDGVAVMMAVGQFLDIPPEDCMASTVVHPQVDGQPYQLVLTSCPKEQRYQPGAKVATTHTVVLADDLRDDDDGNVVLVNPRRRVAA